MPGLISDAQLARYRNLKPIIQRVAQEQNVHSALISGIISVESGFEPRAVNPYSGAAGLMQVMPFHFPRLGWSAPTSVNTQTRIGSGGTGWSDPYKNISAGTQILKDQFRAHKYVKRALAGYGGFVTWLKNGGNPKPDDYIHKVLSRATYFLVWG